MIRIPNRIGRPTSFVAWRMTLTPAFLRRATVLREMPIGVFHDDQGPVGDLADGDRQPTKRHQVGREPEPLHHDKGHERSDDQRHRDNDGAADMAQEEKEDEDHQHNPFDQRIAYRVNGGIHQLNAIVKRDQPCASREDMTLLQILHLRLDRLNHLTGIASAKHEHCSYHDFPLPIEDYRTMANGVADADFSDIPDEHWRATDLFHNDGFDITHGPDQSKPSNDRAFGMTLQHVAADIAVVLHHRLVDIVAASGRTCAAWPDRPGPDTASQTHPCRSHRSLPARSSAEGRRTHSCMVR